MREYCAETDSNRRLQREELHTRPSPQDRVELADAFQKLASPEISPVASWEDARVSLPLPYQSRGTPAPADRAQAVRASDCSRRYAGPGLGRWIAA